MKNLATEPTDEMICAVAKEIELHVAPIGKATRWEAAEKYCRAMLQFLHSQASGGKG